jgi:L-2-hydroxyglutarate oxidase LhgO
MNIQIVNIGGRYLYCMDIPVARIHARVTFHSEIPLVPFLGLVHFRIAFTTLIFG